MGRTSSKHLILGSSLKNSNTAGTTFLSEVIHAAAEEEDDGGGEVAEAVAAFEEVWAAAVESNRVAQVSAQVVSTIEGEVMADVVVTVPKSFGLDTWIAEGDAAGEPWSGQYWAYYLSAVPNIKPGERVYVVCNGRLRGYAPLVQLKLAGLQRASARCALIRGGEAVAVTIPESIKGFMGFRYRWWDRETEVPFAEWRRS